MQAHGTIPGICCTGILKSQNRSILSTLFTLAARFLFTTGNGSTVKPPNRGHFGDGPFVPCREVVLFSEVLF